MMNFKIPTDKALRQKRIFVWIALVFVILITVVSAAFLFPSGQTLSNEQLTDFSDGWTLVLESGAEVHISLPYHCNNSENACVRIEKNLPENMPDGLTLCMKTARQALRADVDGVEIYNKYGDTSLYSGNTPGKLWQVFRISSDMAGKKLTLTFSSHDAAYIGELPQIFCGSKSAALTHIVSINTVYVVFCLLLIAAGIVLLIQHFAYRGIEGVDQSLLYLSLFSISVAFWLPLYSTITQLLIANDFIVIWGSYPLFIFIGMPILLFFDTAYKSKLPKLILPFLLALFSDLFISTFLHFTGIADYRETLFITHILLAVALLWQILIAFIEVIRFHNADAKRFLFITGVLLFCSFAELLNFYIHLYDGVFLFPLGILFYVALLGFDTTRRFCTIQQHTVTEQYYKELAYHDMLTKSRNRTAYTSDSGDICSHGIENGVRLLMFDLNNLKQINDTFGHHTGDDALIRAYNCINFAFGGKGDCYRIGGDEFACILRPCSEADFTGMCTAFDSVIGQEAEKASYPFSVAMGFACYDESIYSSIVEMENAADSMMYQKKREMKAFDLPRFQ